MVHCALHCARSACHIIAIITHGSLLYCYFKCLVAVYLSFFRQPSFEHYNFFSQHAVPLRHLNMKEKNVGEGTRTPQRQNGWCKICTCISSSACLNAILNTTELRCTDNGPSCPSWIRRIRIAPPHSSSVFYFFRLKISFMSSAHKTMSKIDRNVHFRESTSGLVGRMSIDEIYINSIEKWMKSKSCAVNECFLEEKFLWGH